MYWSHFRVYCSGEAYARTLPFLIQALTPIFKRAFFLHWSVLGLKTLNQTWISAFDTYVRKIFYLSYSSGIFFFIEEFQWFLIELSVLPLKNFAISAHLFPRALWDKNSNHYSCSVHSYFFIAGFKWLCHLYLHCLPIRPKLKSLYQAGAMLLKSISERHTSGQVWWDKHLHQKSKIFFYLA